jgi:pimeloyl-ACP methyl ester carboxylesterase
MGERVKAGDIEPWVERRGQGPGVVLIAGLGDPAEAWQPQLEGLADRYRITAFDNPGAARTPLPDKPLSSATMADTAAALLRALEVGECSRRRLLDGQRHRAEACSSAPPARPQARAREHVRSPGSSLSLPADLLALAPEAAPSERAFFEAFFTWVYTPRAHADGTVDQFVEEALAFPHQQSVEAFRGQVDVCLTHDTADRLSEIAAPTLVLSGELDVILPPRFGRSVAAEIPNARFDVMAGEAHQPFQEIPEEFNARVDAFWREADAQG